MAKKQFILIMTDSQRRDMISRCNERGENMHTPCLDRLCDEGLAFNSAYTTQPVCGPARAGLFTGTYPHTKGMLGNCMALSQQSLTIGQRLSRAGIHAAYIGKWHLDGGDYFGDGICPDGWDEEYWYDMRNYLDELESDKDRERSRMLETALEGEGIGEEFTYGYRCTKRALDFMEKHKDEDYFLVVSYDEPHHPFLAPKSYYEPFYKPYLQKANQHMDFSKLPDHIKVWHEKYMEIQGGNGDGCAVGLLGSNSFIDSQIGRVLDGAEKNAEEALVLYTSDHGDAQGSHGIHAKGPAMYEEIINIPFIVRWKDKIQKGISSEMPVSHIDVVPTILDFYGLPQPESLEGESLLNSLTDKNITEIKEGRPVFVEFNRYEVDHDGWGGFQPVRCIVKGKWKLTINLMTQDELYNLYEDADEMHNLIDDPSCEAIRNEMHDLLLDWQNDTRDPLRGYYWEKRPWRKDRQKVSWDCGGYSRSRHREEGEVMEYGYGTGLPIKEYNRKY